MFVCSFIREWYNNNCGSAWQVATLQVAFKSTSIKCHAMHVHVAQIYINTMMWIVVAWIQMSYSNNISWSTVVKWLLSLRIYSCCMLTLIYLLITVLGLSNKNATGLLNKICSMCKSLACSKRFPDHWFATLLLKTPNNYSNDLKAT